MFSKILNFINSKKGVCTAPFSQVYVYPDGRVFFCPDCYVAQMAEIGNLNDNSFDEIWNSDKAKLIRTQVIKGLYCYCDPNICKVRTNYHYTIQQAENIDYSILQKKYPSLISLSIDSECNVNCIMCRGDIFRCSEEEVSSLAKKIDDIYLPILRDAKYLTLSTTGDAFGSRPTRLLLKKAAEKYPDLKFNILTNGILCDEFNCADLGIIDRLGSIMFSVNAATKQTYNNVVKNGNFDKVCENIKWISSLKEKGKVENFFMAFVVSSKNYFEIPDFIDFAKKNKSEALFWVCRDWGGNLDFADEDLQVWIPKHLKYLDLKKILKSVDINNDGFSFSPELLNIRNK